METMQWYASWEDLIDSIFVQVPSSSVFVGSWCCACLVGEQSGHGCWYTNDDWFSFHLDLQLTF